MSRYGDTNYYMSLPYETGEKLLLKAMDKTLDNLAWQMWLTLYPNYTKENFVPFTEYKEKLIGKQKEQTTNEMIAVCRMLNAAYGGTEVVNGENIEK